MELLHSCPEFDVRGELFHPATVYSNSLSRQDISNVMAASQGQITDDRSLCEWRALNPLRTLEIVAERRNLQAVVFKLFPEHLARETIASQLFDRDDIRYILLRRRPIESFISRLKAGEVRAHGVVDTTTFKPVLEATSVANWCRRVKGWYDWLSEEIAARNLPCFLLSYERHLRDKSDAEALSQILESLEGMGLPPVKRPQEIRARVRQDKEVEYRNRVANWPQFESDMQLSLRNARLLEWAETAI